MLTIYHNPRCSKSRQTLSLIEATSTQHEVVLYLQTPLDSASLTELKKQLGVDSFIDMMRIQEQEFASAGLSVHSSESELLVGLTQFPKLLERPIVSNGQTAIIGRPPENVHHLL